MDRKTDIERCRRLCEGSRAQFKQADGNGKAALEQGDTETFVASARRPLCQWAGQPTPAGKVDMKRTHYLAALNAVVR
jgi:hypothetical protein